MKHILSASLFAILAATLGCGGSGTGGISRGNEITPGALSGVWQVTSVTYQGQTLPTLGGESKAAKNGYPNSPEVVHYIFNGNRMAAATSDELAVNSYQEVDYRIAGKRISINVGNWVELFEVTAITGSALTLKFIYPNASDLTINFQKVDSSVLQKFAVQAQLVQYQYKSQTTQFQSAVAASYEPWKSNATRISCNFKKEENNRFLVDVRTEDNSTFIYLLGRGIQFDFTKSEEVIPLKISQQEQGSSFSATLKPDGLNTLNLGLDYSGQCQLQIHRKNRLLVFEGLCSGVSGKSELKVDGNCVLKFD